MVARAGLMPMEQFINLSVPIVIQQLLFQQLMEFGQAPMVWAQMDAT